MTLQQMKYFVAVADSGSISEAAKRLFAAQSSVSEAVRAVEGHYGIKAFLRTPKGVMLTGDGKELFIEFKGILNRLYYLDVRYEDKKDSSHGFYVAAQHHICGMDSFLSIIQSLDVVIKYDDYIALGSENACKEAGKMYIEGKEYVVQDGDIMHFRFNV